MPAVVGVFRRVCWALNWLLSPVLIAIAIGHIIPNVPGDPGQRSPLDEPGCPVKVGDYVIAIDGDEGYDGRQRVCVPAEQV